MSTYSEDPPGSSTVVPRGLLTVWFTVPEEEQSPPSGRVVRDVGPRTSRGTPGPPGKDEGTVSRVGSSDLPGCHRGLIRSEDGLTSLVLSGTRLGHGDQRTPERPTTTPSPTPTSQSHSPTVPVLRKVRGHPVNRTPTVPRSVTCLERQWSRASRGAGKDFRLSPHLRGPKSGSPDENITVLRFLPKLVEFPNIVFFFLCTLVALPGPDVSAFITDGPRDGFQRRSRTKSPPLPSTLTRPPPPPVRTRSPTPGDGARDGSPTNTRSGTPRGRSPVKRPRPTKLHQPITDRSKGRELGKSYVIAGTP